MTKDDKHFRLRLPTDLKEYVRGCSEANHRSMNGEIVHVLRQHQKAASEPNRQTAL